MRKPQFPALIVLLAVLSGCVGAGDAADPSQRYTINVVSLLEVATGNNTSTRGVNRNTSPGTVNRIVDANPGLREALARNGVDLRRVANIRIRPTGVVDVFLGA